MPPGSVAAVQNSITGVGAGGVDGFASVAGAVRSFASNQSRIAGCSPFSTANMSVPCPAF
jgi:hypothetical protein